MSGVSAGRSEKYGLGGRTYIDQAAGNVQATQQEQTLSIRGEVDRIYPGAPASVLVR